MPYTEAQFKSLAIAPKCTSALSLCGTIFIIRDILTSQKKRKLVYHRIIFALSLSDLIVSVCMFLSTWPIPAGTPYLYGTAGTQGTCTAQGFFLQLAIMAPLYNASLSLYYLLMVKFSWSERMLQKLRWPVHGIILTFSIATAVAGLPLTLYNNANLWCWTAPYPAGCEESIKHDGETTCTRGDNASAVYRWAFFYAPLWAAIVFATVAMFLVCKTVSDGQKSSNYLAKSMSSSEGRRMASTMQKKKNTRLRNVATQALWYLGSFYVTWVFPTILRIQQGVNPGGGSPYALVLMIAIFLPFQGFLNFCVYMRPRYQRYKRMNSQSSTVSIVSDGRTKANSWFSAMFKTGTSVLNREIRASVVEEEDYNVALTDEQIAAELEQQRRSEAERGLTDEQIAAEREAEATECLRSAQPKRMKSIRFENEDSAREGDDFEPDATGGVDGEGQNKYNIALADDQIAAEREADATECLRSAQPEKEESTRFEDEESAREGDDFEPDATGEVEEEGQKNYNIALADEQIAAKREAEATECLRSAQPENEESIRFEDEESGREGDKFEPGA